MRYISVILQEHNANLVQVVLPVVARKKGMDGHYEQGDGSPKPKAESPVAPVSPQPSTMTYCLICCCCRHLEHSDTITPSTDHHETQTATSLSPWTSLADQTIQRTTVYRLLPSLQYNRSQQRTMRHPSVSIVHSRRNPLLHSLITTLQTRILLRSWSSSLYQNNNTTTTMQRRTPDVASVWSCDTCKTFSSSFLFFCFSFHFCLFGFLQISFYLPFSSACSSSLFLRVHFAPASDSHSCL